MENWTVLETFLSEAEARVAESFLRAQGLEVQLLDTHMNAYPPPSGSRGRGMRLMVRVKDLDIARELLMQGQRGSHLEIVGEQKPIAKSWIEGWMFWIVLFALIAAIAVSYLE